MKIPFSINDNNNESPVAKMLESSQIFYYLSFKEILGICEKKIIILKTNTSQKKLYETIEYFSKDDFGNIFFLIHHSLKNMIMPKHTNTIIYPIHLQSLVEKIVDKKESNYFYSDLFLSTANTLSNTIRKKSVYMTETESEIIKSLFAHKEVEKETIRKKILKLNKDVETKSLDSHLSRIRKKIKQINSKVEIFTINNKVLIGSLVD